MDSKYDHTMKLLLVGDSSVGKSDLILRLVGEFPPKFDTTIGVDFKIKTVQLDDKVIKLQIWDTAGQEQFRTITASYYRGAHGIMLVFSVYDRVSFRKIASWLRQTEKHAADNVEKIIIGHHFRQEEGKEIKKQEREVSEEEAREFSQENGLEYFEIDGMKVKAREKEEDLDGFLLEFTKTIYESHTGKC